MNGSITSTNGELTCELWILMKKCRFSPIFFVKFVRKPCFLMLNERKYPEIT